MSEQEAVHVAAAAWLAKNWRGDRSLREWREILVDSGWGRPSWPSEWFGRGLDPVMDAVVHEEFRRGGAVGVAPGHAVEIIGPTLLRHASDQIRQLFLRCLLTGEDEWCQLFSEPGAGSDLAGLSAAAVPDGKNWRVTGQKTWSSGARDARFGLLLARTSKDGDRHSGITCFVLDMQAPGVQVRPIRQMNGHATFNEVFLTDVMIASDLLVGDVGQGWSVALTALALERRLSGGMAALPRRTDTPILLEAREEARALAAPFRWYRQRAGRPDLLIAAARASGHRNDAVLRQELVTVFGLVRTAEWTTARVRAARRAGRPTGPEGSIAKLHGSDIARRSAALHARIAGMSATITGEVGAGEGVIAEVVLSVPAASIAGGTDQIQRSVIAERILGLPREPSISD
jgi:alkylation response protein AidB-like acyl-CoA dehydrogenase